MSDNSNGIDLESGIDVGLLEKRLEGLRDTQESVQGLSLWIQSNKRHSNTITDTWLKVLRKSPVEKRLTMFYLANDVVQHAKRKSDVTVVNQWAFAVQKATPHVRSPSSVSSAITRIFKIWEERGVYSKEAVADLMSLLNNVSSKEKVETKKPETYTANAEKVSAFQPSTLITKIKLASRLKSHLGTTFRTKSYYQMDMDTLKNSIKDRQHGQEVIQEMGALLEQLRASEQKLQSEVDERRKIVETAEIAIVFYENVRSESEIVNSAYKSFTARIMKAKEAVDSKLKSFEDMEKEPSPCPSPPIAAPSPSEDEDNGIMMRHSQIPSFHSNTSSGNNNNDSLTPSLDSQYFNTSSPRAVSQSNSISSLSQQQPVNSSSSSSSANNNMPMAYTPQIPLLDSNLENSQKIGGHTLQSWADCFMNYQMQQNIAVAPQIPAQNFNLTPSMQLQMQMQQQHIQAYGYPPNSSDNKYEQPDISSIPLPPQNPSVPPLPSPTALSSHDNQYPPPLPPSQRKEIPAESMPIPVYQPPLPVETQAYTSQNSQDESVYQSQNPPDDVYSSQKQQQQHQVLDQVYPASQSEENTLNEYQNQASFCQPLASPNNLKQQYEQSSSSHSAEFNEYEPPFVDSQNQQNFISQQHHYSPKNSNFHPYNSNNNNNSNIHTNNNNNSNNNVHRSHPGTRLPGPRGNSPLMSPPLMHPRSQARNSVNNRPRMLRPQSIGENFSGNNNNPSNVQKIPSLLDTPVSPRGNLLLQPQHQRPNQPMMFSNMDNPGDSSGVGQDDNYQYDQKFEFQQQARNFGDTNPNMRMFRGQNRFRGGGFRGARMRGSGPGGPRRGRY